MEKRVVGREKWPLAVGTGRCQGGTGQDGHKAASQTVIPDGQAWREPAAGGTWVEVMKQGWPFPRAGPGERKPGVRRGSGPGQAGISGQRQVQMQAWAGSWMAGRQAWERPVGVE